MLEGFNEWIVATSRRDIPLFTLDPTSGRVSTILETLRVPLIPVVFSRRLRLPRNSLRLCVETRLSG